MTRLYLAGPMAGMPDHNYPLFHSEAARLRGLGYEIINPAEINLGADSVKHVTMQEQTRHWQQCMKKDIAALLTCSGIVLLPGYHYSGGALLEASLARTLGLTIQLTSDLQVNATEV